jgi:sugar/nucleoside kinase (ribokinase family)
MTAPIPFSVVAIGSIKIDLIADLSPDLTLDAADVYDVAPLTVRIGGTAGTFSSAAVQHFDSVGVIAAIGDDVLTYSLVRHINELGVVTGLQHCPNVPNGVVLSLRSDKSDQRRRLLVASRDSAHHHLSPSHILERRRMIETADVLVCDGYFLKSDRAQEAVTTAMKLAKDAGVSVVFDLVPHSLPAATTLDTLLPVLESADIVVVEARTIVGLVERRWPLADAPDAQLAATAARYATQVHDCTWLLRYGEANISDVLRLDRDGRQTSYPTGYSREEGAWGFGERLLVRELKEELLRREQGAY